MTKRYCITHRLIHSNRYEAELYQADYLLNHSYNVPENWYETYKAYHCDVCNGWHTTTRARQTGKQFTIIILKGKGITMAFDFDIEWDKPEELDESNLSTGSYPDWGLLELAAVKNVTLFAKGETLTLPEIVINGQPFTRNGIKLGGPTKAFFFTLKGNNSQTGEPFTAVRMYHNQAGFKIEDKDKYPHLYLTEKQQAYLNKNGSVYVSDWANMQKPVLANVLKDKVQRLDKGGLWVRAENTTYHVRETDQLDNESKPKKYYAKYWSDFTIFETEAAMLAAKAEEVGASVQSNGLMYPANLVDWVDMTNNTLKKFVESGLSHKEAAIKGQLMNDKGVPSNDVNGNPVNVKAILAKALDVPEDFITL